MQRRRPPPAPPGPLPPRPAPAPRSYRSPAGWNYPDAEPSSQCKAGFLPAIDILGERFQFWADYFSRHYLVSTPRWVPRPPARPAAAAAAASPPLRPRTFPADEIGLVSANRYTNYRHLIAPIAVHQRPDHRMRLQ